MTEKNIKTAIIFFIILSAAAGSAYFFRGRLFGGAPAGTAPAESGRVAVAASFYPLYDFAKNAGGEYVSVENITPAGAEPHDYEPSPGDIAKIYRAGLFIYNGGGVDPWGDKIRDELEKNGVTVLKMSDYFGSPDNPAGVYDPHFWLDPQNAEKEADLIAAALIKIDPGHKDGYIINRDDFKKKLSELDARYRSGLADCALREIVVSHNAFAYLAARYGFTAYYISGLTPDEEPSPQKMAEIAKLAKEKNIGYIFFETLVSSKLADTIAAEIGAKTLVLNPVEGLTAEEIGQGEDYLSVMGQNLVNLKIAMRCP